MLLRWIFMSLFVYLCFNWSFADSVGWYQGSSELNCGISWLLYLTTFMPIVILRSMLIIWVQQERGGACFILESLLIEKMSHVLNNELSLYLVNCTKTQCGHMKYCIVLGCMLSDITFIYQGLILARLCEYESIMIFALLWILFLMLCYIKFRSFRCKGVMMLRLLKSRFGFFRIPFRSVKFWVSPCSSFAGWIYRLLLTLIFSDSVKIHIIKKICALI